MDGDIYEDWMDSHESPQHLQQQQQQTWRGLHAIRLQMKRVGT
jgi:hypothetical protein